MHTACALLLLLSCPLVPRAQAADSVSIEFGRSSSSYTDVSIVRAGVQWNWQMRLLSAGDWYLGGFWDFNVGYWRNESDPRIRTSGGAVDIGLTPMLRWQEKSKGHLSPFIDAGVGLHWLSEDSITSLRNLSGHLQFGSVLGAGILLGSKGEYEVGYRMQHLSNAGLRQPNNGINLQSIRLKYHF